LAAILRARFFTLPRGYQAKATAKALIAAAGSVHPHDLTSAHVVEVDEQIKTGGYAHATRRQKANCLKSILRWLWEEHGAPKLDAFVTRHPGLRPRNVTVSDAELDGIMSAAPDYMRLLLTLCSDLALRSGTAGRIGPEHYDPQRKTLRFKTKYGAHLTLPVTDAARALIESCAMDSRDSFVRQLQRRHHSHGAPPDPDIHVPGALDKQTRDLLTAAGITRRITPHDLRRTTAVAMLEHTHDVRDVQAILGHRSLQSTIWYLDHDLRPVSRQTLESIKRPFLVPPKEKTA
jgi:integrase